MCVCVCVCVCVRVCVCACVCACVYINTHYSNMFMHTYVMTHALGCLQIFFYKEKACKVCASKSADFVSAGLHCQFLFWKK